MFGDCGCISQASEALAGNLFDVDCQLCGDIPLHVLADNFRMFEETQVLGVKIWGTYTPEGIPSEPDPFTVVFREDTEGRPGAVIASYSPVAGTRTLIRENEYEYFIGVDETLPSGNYWVEVYEAHNDTQETWVWYEATLDATFGSPRVAFSLEMPEVWEFAGAIDLAFELICAANVTMAPSFARSPGLEARGRSSNPR